jgi:sigma-54 specific flagellar transcriptional regulator A
MPPLRKRASDLPKLFEELLVSQCGSGSGRLRLSARALAALSAYDWPGNIRELGNLVERLAILKPEGTIEFEDLPAKYQAAAPADDLQPIPATSAGLRDYLQSVECDLIRQAMSASGGVTAQAARLLKLQRTTLVEKLSKYDLH